jgi:hypothetical protein
MEVQEQSVCVRLLIFSGRPDPEWSLGGTFVEPLAERVRKTIGGERIHPPPAGGLGYRGFLVNCKGQEPALPAQFLIFHGVLVEQPGPRAVYWRDSGGVEEFLLAEARQRGFDKMLEALGVRAKSPQ